MTDDRQPHEPQAPDQAPPPPQPAEPAPLAPIVDQARAGAPGPADETTTQPTGSWSSAGAYPAPPPIAPPAVQPAASWAPPPAAAVATRPRTGLALAAGILLILLGALGALAALALLTIGRAFIEQFDFSSLPGLENVNDPGAFVASAATFGGILVLGFSILYIVGGVGVMRSREWGRVIGIVIGILAGLFWLAGLGGGSRAAGTDASFTLVLLAVHAYIAIALLFFWRTRSAPG
jgi:hypothetical protein